MKKSKEYFQKMEDIKEDAIKYLEEYLIPLCEGKITFKDQEYFEYFFPDEFVKRPILICKIEDSSIMIRYVYDHSGLTKIEPVSIEKLGFIAIIQLVEILEKYVE